MTTTSTASATSATSTSRKPTRGSTLVAAALLVVGVAIGLVAGGEPELLPGGLVRTGVLLVGLVLAYQGYRGLGRARWGDGWDPVFWLATGWIVLIVSVAVLAPLLPFDDYQDTVSGLQNPSLAPPDLFSSHPLGTNVSGLDLTARIVYGARVSLMLAIIAALTGLVVGGLVGMVAGLWRGGVDATIGVVNDALLAFPGLVLLLAIAAVLPRNSFNIAIALGILAIPINVRLSRANTLKVAEESFVEASHTMGFSRPRILIRDILPNVVPSLATYALILMALLLVAEASLSYLGLGVQLPTPSWGNMVAEGDGGRFLKAPHVVLVPGMALFLSVFSFNVVGDRLRRKWDLDD